MTEKEFIRVVSETNADINQFTEEDLSSKAFQELAVTQLMTSEQINVYYHSYHLLHKIAESRANDLVRFWDAFVKLLSHGNSYHRNYGMDLVSLLAVAVDEERLRKVLPEFYKQLEDPKISTRKYCINYSLPIINAKPVLAPKILTRIVGAIDVEDIPVKHKALLVKEFIKVLDESGVFMEENLWEILLTIVESMDSKPLKKEMNKLVHKRANGL